MLRQKRFWFGLIISVSFLAIFLARTDFGQIRGSFSGANYALAFSAVPLYFIGFWFRTMRWRYLLKPVNDIRTRRLYPVVLIGLMTNNVAPARVGELVRAYLLGERERMSKSTALGTIAVDRAFDGLTLVAILGIVIAFSGANSEVKSIGAATAVLFIAATAVLVAMAFSPRRGRALLMRFVRLLPEALAEKIEGVVDSFVIGLLAIRSPWVLLQAGAASFASWMTEATMYYLVGQAFHLGMGFQVYLVILGAANLALSVFASPGGVGPFEVATREVLVFFNVQGGSAAASAYALALHALLLGPVICIGFVLLWSGHMSLGQLLGTRPEAPPAVPGAQGIE